MAIQISTALAIYFVIWWVALFLTLPFGVRSQHEDGVGAPGTDPGAPILTRMGRKLIWTTIISAVIYGIGVRGLSCRLSLDRAPVEIDGNAVLGHGWLRVVHLSPAGRGRIAQQPG
ncbi:putative secreted protein [Bradyrhizobium sp. USDA 329]